jgi:Icc-related predicted phosphoesterase
VKVVCLSDTHGQIQKISIPEGDVVVHAGDFSATGSMRDHIEFASFLGALPHKYKLVVPGNHDRCSQIMTEGVREVFKFHGVTLLIDEAIEIEGKKFYGSPWTPTFGRWHWMKDRGRSIGRMWDGIPTGLDMLITHGPPHGILDWSIYSKVNCGCEELIKAVYDKKPRHHVFGHIHNSGGMVKAENGMSFHNVAICDEDYKPQDRVQVVEL